MPTSIFVSYCRKDSDKKDCLVRLMAKSPDLFRPVVVVNRENPSKLLSDKVKEAISESTIFLPILTKAAITSQWVNQEIGCATAKERQIIPLVSLSVLHKLKAFIHDKQDLPFHFDDTVPGKEQAPFSRCCRKLIRYLRTLSIPTKTIRSFNIDNRISIQVISSIVYQLYRDYNLHHTKILFPATSSPYTNSHSHAPNGYFDWLIKNNVLHYRFKFWDKHFRDNYMEIEVNHEKSILECLCNLDANRNEGFLHSLQARLKHDLR